MRVEFDEWLPDQADLVAGATRVWNVLPTVGPGYEVAPGFAPSQYSDLPVEPLKIQAFYFSDGSIQTFAFCKTKIYRYDGSAWTDASRSGNYTWTAETIWSVVQWGDVLFATNGNQPLQKLAASATSFADAATGLTNGMKCKFLLIVRDFLVCISCADATGSNRYPFRIHWSGRLRPEDFAPSLSTMAGFRDVPDIGTLVAGSDGDFGIILGTKGNARLDYIGAPAVWQVSTLDKQVGCSLPLSVIKFAGTTFWYSAKGWRRSDGGPSEPFGIGKVDGYFRQRIDQAASIGYMSAFVLPDTHIIGWSYVTNDSTDGKTDALIFYNTLSGRFSEAECLYTAYGTFAASEPFTDDTLFGEVDVDTLDTLSDPPSGATHPLLVGIGRDLSINTITEFADYFEIITREFELAPGRRARITRVRLLGEGQITTYEARVSSRDMQPPSTIQSDPWVRSEPTGSCAVDRRGRYHRVAIRGQGNMPVIFAVDVDGVVVGTK